MEESNHDLHERINQLERKLETERIFALQTTVLGRLRIYEAALHKIVQERGFEGQLIAETALRDGAKPEVLKEVTTGSSYRFEYKMVAKDK